MALIRVDETACRNALAKLDSYLDNELLVETSLEIEGHLQTCEACANEIEERQNLRARLRSAARVVKTPAGLERRVRDRLRLQRQPLSGQFYLMSIAAALAICFGTVLVG